MGFKYEDGKSFLNPFAEMTNDEYCILADMMTSAYAMKKMAEVYRHGGHYTANATHYYCSEEKEKQMNKELEELLGKIWVYAEELEPKILERANQKVAVK